MHVCNHQEPMRHRHHTVASNSSSYRRTRCWLAALSAILVLCSCSAAEPTYADVRATAVLSGCWPGNRPTPPGNHGHTVGDQLPRCSTTHNYYPSNDHAAATLHPCSWRSHARSLSNAAPNAGSVSNPTAIADAGWQCSTIAAAYATAAPR